MMHHATAAAIDTTLSAVATVFDVSQESVVTRAHRVVNPAKQAAIWILRNEGLSLKCVGKAFGLHHVTVMYHESAADRWSGRLLEQRQEAQAIVQGALSLSKQSPTDRLSALEQRVAELEAKVAALEAKWAA